MQTTYKMSSCTKPQPNNLLLCVLAIVNGVSSQFTDQKCCFFFSHIFTVQIRNTKALIKLSHVRSHLSFIMWYKNVLQFAIYSVKHADMQIFLLYYYETWNRFISQSWFQGNGNSKRIYLVINGFVRSNR